MEYDKTIEKWLKKRSERELKILHALMTDERIKNNFLLDAFRWTIRECRELSNLAPPISSTHIIDDILKNLENVTDAQIGCILKYRESGICVRCKKPLSGIIKEFNKKNEGEFYLADYLFISVHQRSGLCTNCIEEFLLGHIKKLKF
jgi:hypothetical protein